MLSRKLVKMMTKKFVLDEILEMDSMFRRNLMNSVEGFKNAVLVGTQDHEQRNNLAIFNSVVHIGATPPLIGFIHRPVSVPKQTFTNIQLNGSFTLNLIHEELVQQAHQTSARYAPDISEFDSVGLTPEFSDKITAPYVKESRVKFGMVLEEIIPIPANGTYLIIGKVEEMYVPDETIATDGFVDLSASGILACAGLDSYYRPQPLGRFEYAKPGQPVRKKV